MDEAVSIIPFWNVAPIGLHHCCVGRRFGDVRTM